MGMYESNRHGQDLESIIGDATDEQLSMVAEAADEPYLKHVKGKLLSGKPIIHEVTDWHGEMQSHVTDKFPLSPELASLAIACCEASLRMEGIPRG